MLVFITDKTRLERHFRIDPVLYAYCLGDLEEPWFSNCQWAGFYTATGNIAEDRHVQDVALIFHHGDSCTLQAFAQTDLMRAELHLLSPLLPDSVHLHADKASYADSLHEEFMIVTPAQPRVKMSALHRPEKLDDFLSTKTNRTPTRLEGRNAGEANELFSVAYPEAGITAEVLDAAPFFGVWVNNRLVAIGGCHVWSGEQKVVTIGGVATHPEHRNQGYARAILASIMKLVPPDFIICLNVATDNPPAHKAYEKLGFVKTHEYWEVRLTRK